jgi:lipopolysaccharide/colanic/teichoic acid biosynthesis glycosyltransferase
MKLHPHPCTSARASDSNPESSAKVPEAPFPSFPTAVAYWSSSSSKLRKFQQPPKPEQPLIDVTRTMGAAGNPSPPWKRFIDITGCLLALPFLALCSLAMLILMKCISPGPLFFRQERIGYMGRRFKIYKFRTMKVGSDCAVHRNYTAQLISSNAAMMKLDSHGDTRLIPGAWVLRACGLDELPQIINVLRGEMSLVGPRPCVPSEFECYTRSQRRRCDCVPGLTGLWQVSGKNRTTFEQMVRLDLRYARQASFCLDLKIILLTVPALVGQLRDSRRLKTSSVSPSAERAQGDSSITPKSPTSQAPTVVTGCQVSC